MGTRETNHEEWLDMIGPRYDRVGTVCSDVDMFDE